MGSLDKRLQKNWEAMDAETRESIRRHYKTLGLSTLDDYIRWREASGFGTMHNLRRVNRAEEMRVAMAAYNRARLSARVEVLTPKAVDAVLDARRHGELSPRFKAFAETIPQTRRDTSIRLALGRLLKHLSAVGSSLLQEDDTLHGLLIMASRFDAWLRDPEKWRPPSYNRARQFGSLVRHLFSRHDVPAFLESAWLCRWGDPDGTKFRMWYVALGRGGSIRHEDGFLIPLTKTRAHWFLRVPDGTTIPHAFRWAQVMAYCGSSQLAAAVCATRLGAHFDNEEFWDTVVRFFGENPFLAVDRVGPIVDYLQNQKFEKEFRRPNPNAPGEWVVPQPKLSMKGRTVQSLLRAVEEWHERIGAHRARFALECNWSKSGIPAFEFETGEEGGSNSAMFASEEILSARNLVAEGRLMKHCVGSYTHACKSGRVSIWSLYRKDDLGLTPLLTVEISNSDRTIMQARGKLNRRPTQQEMGLLNRWAAQARLKLSKWL